MNEVWILTDFSWYKLGLPSKVYAPIYEEMIVNCGRKRKKVDSVPFNDKELIPVVTPTVSKLAKGLFLRSELLTGHTIDEIDKGLANVCVSDARFAVHDSNPEHMEWGERIEGTDCYKSVVLDGISYHVS